MSLVTLRSVLRASLKGNYAVGSFNFFGLENVQGIIKGAANLKAPVIVQASPGAVKHMGEKAICGMVAGLADESGVPVVLHLDHATDYDFICRCINNGFTSVMIDASRKSLQENIDLTSRVVDYAARRGVSVEAELGKVGGSEEEIKVEDKDAYFTNPEDVVTFVKATGIDALAIAVGTIHGFYKSEPKLDFDRIAAIRNLSDIPLVLHGGTGIPDNDLTRAIFLGINKINVGTELWLVGYGNTLKKYASIMPDNSDPRKVMEQVREACMRIVEEKITVFGSAGKA
jgi:ketose-bisphosphate aldolase